MPVKSSNTGGPPISPMAVALFPPSLKRRPGPWVWGTSQDGWAIKDWTCAVGAVRRCLLPPSPHDPPWSFSSFSAVWDGWFGLAEGCGIMELREPLDDPTGCLQRAARGRQVEIHWLEWMDAICKRRCAEYGILPWTFGKCQMHENASCASPLQLSCGCSVLGVLTLCLLVFFG